MKSSPVILGVLAGALTLFSASAAPQGTPAGGGLQTTEFKPGFDDVMTMMVQPRHIKLYAAGKANNWELAAFQLKELRSSFRRAGQYLPSYRGKSVSDSVTALMEQSLQETEKAIGAKNATQFAEAYTNLTAACNSCHIYMQHAFLVIQVPSEAAPSIYPDQRFQTK